jgi:ParB/RepB/Spo0J family partition protein
MLDPNTLQIPEVRVTSTWPPELLEMLKGSIEAEGIQQPLMIAEDGKNLWVIDGLHRLEEAKLQGMKQVPCIVITAGMKDVLLKNLYMNRLRGGVKASEMVKVMSSLRNDHGMDSEEIARATGLKRDYIEKLLETSKAIGEVQEALDREEIGVGQAWELARIQSRDIQLRLLNQVFTYRLTIKQLHDIVDQTLEIIKLREDNPTAPPPFEPGSIPTVRCHLCDNEHPIRKVVGINICMGCYGISFEAVQQAKKKGVIPTDSMPTTTPTPPPPHED